MIREKSGTVIMDALGPAEPEIHGREFYLLAMDFRVAQAFAEIDMGWQRSSAQGVWLARRGNRVRYVDMPTALHGRDRRSGVILGPSWFRNPHGEELKAVASARGMVIIDPTKWQVPT